MVCTFLVKNPKKYIRLRPFSKRGRSLHQKCSDIIRKYNSIKKTIKSIGHNTDKLKERKQRNSYPMVIQIFSRKALVIAAVFMATANCGEKLKDEFAAVRVEDNRSRYISNKQADAVADVPSGKSVSSTASGEPGSDENKQTASVEPVQILPLTGEEAVTFLSDKCLYCHGVGKDYYSFWPQPEGMNEKNLAVDPFRLAVYQSIYNMARAFQPNGQPSPMPTEIQDDAAREVGKKMISWIRKELPEIAFAADTKYGNSDSPINGIKFNFTCSTPLTVRQYLRKFTNDAFGREPTSIELLALGDPQKRVTEKIKTNIAERIMDVASGGRKEFISYGLKTFARKFAGSADLKPRLVDKITEATVTDLKDEFYRKLEADIDKFSFKDILLSNSVMVTDKTAFLYGGPSESCPLPGVDKWGRCQMKGPRETFWGTVGFLASKPTSFLDVNNNYGRAAFMQFGITGDVFLAATDGPRGEVIAPLPSCLKIKDFRGTVQPNFSVAPFGAAKIPQTGNICQSCHIARNLALGSFVFRPFSGAGTIFTTDSISVTDPVNGPKVATATATSIISQEGPKGAPVAVDVAYLQSLLTQSGGTESGCIPKGGKDGADIAVNTLGELAAVLIGTGEKTLGEGLARHIPRSLSNQATTTSEITNTIQDSLKSSGGKLLPAFVAYFRSETYSCAVEATQSSEVGK
jgi:hypothetical protein